MKRIIFFLAIGLIPQLANAQFSAIGYVEAGYEMQSIKSEQLFVFTNSYNSYWASSGLSQAFPDKIPVAKGKYLKFGCGIGGPNCKMILDFGILKMMSDPMSARFTDKTGRDLSIGIRNSNTDIGIRFGGGEDVPIWGQFDMNIFILDYSIYSRAVFADGSTSIASDHWLNGIYEDNILSGGVGLTIGYRVYGPVNVFAHFDIVPNFGKKEPQYHQFEDLVEFKDAFEFLPSDVASYNAGNNYASDNAISDDFVGKHFSFGIQLQVGK